MIADTILNDKMKQYLLEDYSMLIFVSLLKQDFSNASDCQFDSDNVGLSIQSLGAYLQLIFLEKGL